MQLALRRWLDQWLFQLRGPRPGPVELVHRRIFILPNRHGYGFALVLLLMLAGSVNYSLSLGFVLTFLLGAMAINGIVHTFRNLAGLSIAALRTRPVFAGDPAHFPIAVRNPRGVARTGVNLSLAGIEPAAINVEARGEATVMLAVPTSRRGWLRPGRITVDTRFPLGIFRAWSYVELDAACLVYPQPEPAGAALPDETGEPGDGSASSRGNEDFAGLRAWYPGDSPRHIAWKADARGQGLLTKLFSGRSESRLWLDWDSLPAALDTEAKLARLTRWVLDADQQGYAWGLRIPGTTFEPSTGEGHRDRCLEALALYDEKRRA